MYSSISRFIAVVGLFLWSAHAVAATCGQDLGQGWTKCDREWWYTVSQGSRLLPLDWMQALEIPGATDKVLSKPNIVKFNYLPNDKVDGLPVGFAIDKGVTGHAPAMCRTFPSLCANGTMARPWVGMNCSACHSNEITYKGKSLRIDGAPTLADFQGFFEQILASLTQTRSDQVKFDRFAKSVLGTQVNSAAVAKLQQELDEVIAWETRLAKKNDALIRYGFGRLDAQGHILNKIALSVGAADPLIDTPANAPASYPHIWNAPQHDLVQWNGIAPNKIEYSIAGLKTNVGALARNTAEVIGVFAQIDSNSSDWLGGYSSSLQLQNMVDIERKLGTLRSPKWPEDVLGRINTELLPRGKQIYESACSGCHTVIESNDLKTKITADMRSLWSSATDLALACNSFFHRSKSGDVVGRPTWIVLGEPIKSADSTLTLLKHMTAGAIVEQRGELAKKALADLLTPLSPFREFFEQSVATGEIEFLPGVSDAELKQRAKRCLLEAGPDFKQKNLAYKARPLNGIWATAPFLHNGSVPTLYDLLLPSTVRNTIRPGETGPANGQPVRPELFYVGSREFDPVRVGFVQMPSESQFKFRVRDDAGVPIMGNYNSGHDYGTQMNETDRRSLVEYLKTL